MWFWDENSSCTILQKRITIFFCIHPQEVQKYALFILINVYFWLKHWLRTPPTSIRTHRSYDGSVPHDFLVSSLPLSTLRMLISAVYLPMSEHTETVCSFGHLYLENAEWQYSWVCMWVCTCSLWWTGLEVMRMFQLEVSWRALLQRGLLLVLPWCFSETHFEEKKKKKLLKDTASIFW